MQVETISHCRICNSSNLENFISLGKQALSGHFPKPGEFVPSSNLSLVECKSCGLIQLTESVDKKLLYGDNYGYRSSLNRSMVSHLKSIADMIKSRKFLNENSLIVDIGANDGTFIKNFLVGNKLAIDPTIKKFNHYYTDTGINYIEDFFSIKYVSPDSCDLITSFAMFYDLDKPVEFAAEIAKCLKDDGMWVLEVADFPRLASMGVYDVICHEHLQYYGFKQLAYIMNKAGLFIKEAMRTECNGGSILLFVSKNKSSVGFIDYKFDGYEDKVKSNRTELMKLIEGKNVAGFGASTKGNTIIQYCGITKEHLPFIIDINSDKFGCVTPGSNIPIVSEGEADYYLVFPWHFKQGIIANNPNKRFIFPLPTLEVIDNVLTNV